ncbi:hypothetical protein pb186bvf_004979 [Paramecium bursaria]
MKERFFGPNGKMKASARGRDEAKKLSTNLRNTLAHRPSPRCLTIPKR